MSDRNRIRPLPPGIRFRPSNSLSFMLQAPPPLFAGQPPPMRRPLGPPPGDGPAIRSPMSVAPPMFRPLGPPPGQGPVTRLPVPVTLPPSSAGYLPDPRHMPPRFSVPPPQRSPADVRLVGSGQGEAPGVSGQAGQRQQTFNQPPPLFPFTHPLVQQTIRDLSQIPPPTLNRQANVPPTLTGQANVPPTLTGQANVPPTLTRQAIAPPTLTSQGIAPPTLTRQVVGPPSLMRHDIAPPLLTRQVIASSLQSSQSIEAPNIPRPLHHQIQQGPLAQQNAVQYRAPQLPNAQHILVQGQPDMQSNMRLILNASQSHTNLGHGMLLASSIPNTFMLPPNLSSAARLESVQHRMESRPVGESTAFFKNTAPPDMVRTSVMSPAGGAVNVRNAFPESPVAQSLRVLSNPLYSSSSDDRMPNPPNPTVSNSHSVVGANFQHKYAMSTAPFVGMVTSPDVSGGASHNFSLRLPISSTGLNVQATSFSSPQSSHSFSNVRCGDFVLPSPMMMLQSPNQPPAMQWEASPSHSISVISSVPSRSLSDDQMTRVSSSSRQREERFSSDDRMSLGRSPERRSSTSSSSRDDTLSPVDLFDMCRHDNGRHGDDERFSVTSDERDMFPPSRRDSGARERESKRDAFPSSRRDSGARDGEWAGEKLPESRRSSTSASSYNGTSSESAQKRSGPSPSDDFDRSAKRSRSDSNHGDGNGDGTPCGTVAASRRRLSSLSGGTAVFIAPAGTPCSAATFNIFKCDFCRATADTAVGMDAHLIGSKHLSGSEFGARAALGDRTELVYIVRTLAVRNGRVGNKSTVIACPVCREVFDDVFVCALHHKYDHTGESDATVLTTGISARAQNHRSGFAFSFDPGNQSEVSGCGGYYSVCPVIACETYSLPRDDEAACEECNYRYSSRDQLFAHWLDMPQHMPASSRLDNPQVFLLGICLFCQRTFRDDFLGCAKHVAAHFDSSTAHQRKLTMDVKQVMVPLRHEELPRFDGAPNSDGMRDELLALFRLRDTRLLGSSGQKAVDSRICQLQKQQAAHLGSVR